MRTSALGWVKTLWLLAEDQHLDPCELFRQAGLESAQLNNPYYRFPQDGITRFWELMVEKTGNPAIGLHFGRLVNVSTFNAVGYAMLSSPTLKQALYYAQRYQKYLSEATTIELTEQGDQVYLSMTNLGDKALATIQSVEASLSAFIHFSRWISLPSFKPIKVCLGHSPTTSLLEYEAIFACPIEAGCAQTHIVLSVDIMNQQLFSYDPVLHKIHLQLAEEQRSAVVRPTVNKLHEIFNSLVPLGQANIDQVCVLIHCSGKTLQRRLQAENTSFKAELDAYCFDLACKYLKQAHLDLTHVALLCGYADYSAFAKAFRRWSGLSPKDWRAQQKI